MRKNDIKGTRNFKKLTTKNISYNDLFQEYYRYAEIKGRSESTLKTYVNNHKYFMEFLEQKYGKNPTTDTITEDTMGDYVIYLKEIKNTDNGNTINSYLRNISPVIKFGYKKGYIPEEFPIPYLKVQETFKDIYTIDEMDALLQKPKRKEFTEYRTWAIIWTLASTGVRAKELRMLRLGNVDLLNRSIVVNATKNKKARYLPISNSLAEVLEEYLEIRKGDREDYLFPSVFNEELAMSSLQKAMRIYCKDRGVDRSSLHLFRHTFITNAVNTNVSPLLLKRITGHSTLKELNRYYNAKLGDIVSIIDDIAPKNHKRKNQFKK